MLGQCEASAKLWRFVAKAHSAVDDMLSQFEALVLPCQGAVSLVTFEKPISEKRTIRIQQMLLIVVFYFVRPANAACFHT